jgi:formamidopyrimidine-DNA glycosylase
MPELPEVEMVVRTLRKVVVGRKILAAELLYKRLAPDHSAKNFARLLHDVKVTAVERRAKFILLKLDSGHTLAVHLRMTGRFLLLDIDAELPKHTTAVFYLDNDKRLIFNDQRHFGWMKIVKDNKLADLFSDLAPEPFSAEFSPAYLFDVMQGSRRAVKEFLLDQSKVCGLGNIYASEALSMSAINPKTPANKVSRKRIAPLHTAIVRVLNDSIEHGSTLLVDPNRVDESYYGGDYEKHWRVYDQEGEPCETCKTPIKRIVQGARSTYYCSKCQRR